MKRHKIVDREVREARMLDSIAAMLNEVRHTTDMLGDVASQAADSEDMTLDESEKHQAEAMLESAEQLCKQARQLLSTLDVTHQT